MTKTQSQGNHPGEISARTNLSLFHHGIGKFYCKIDMKKIRKNCCRPSYSRYIDGSLIFESGQTFGKGISCRKLYIDDIPQYGRIRWKVHPGISVSIRKVGKVTHHVPHHELEPRTLSDTVNSTQ